MAKERTPRSDETPMSRFNVRTFQSPMLRIEFRQTFPTKRVVLDPTNPVTTYNEAGMLARRLGLPRPDDPPPIRRGSEPWIVVTGAMASGLTFRGPFKTREAAEAFRLDWEAQGGGVASVAKLQLPEDPEAKRTP